MLSLEKDIKMLLPKIKAPTLFLWGENDMTTPLKAAQEFSQLVKGSELVVLDGVFHEGIIWFTDKFTNIISDFIVRT